MRISVRWRPKVALCSPHGDAATYDGQRTDQSEERDQPMRRDVRLARRTDKGLFPLSSSPPGPSRPVTALSLRQIFLSFFVSVQLPTSLYSHDFCIFRLSTKPIVARLKLGNLGYLDLIIRGWVRKWGEYGLILMAYSSLIESRFDSISGCYSHLLLYRKSFLHDWLFCRGACCARKLSHDFAPLSPGYASPLSSPLPSLSRKWRGISRRHKIQVAKMTFRSKLVVEF